ncbi:hypothetical protein O6H91_12G076600 [Diphasiastrum complanatum]|uniref:Uncharacterized protein n=1 Tax=Diphasiastrum complanatum TaxID=34168 RepID=A0ACC2C3Q5_DIPCM|nr:hypothetical protein O6H91_12G076600 [Diphasiastrum complanatum]
MVMATSRSPPSSFASNSPCAACKFLRRKCTSECVLAPYFPSDEPQKFANVHKIFGASNVAKLLSTLPNHQKEDAVTSLVFEAAARMMEPVYGCVGAISVLQRQIAQLQQELSSAHAGLASYADVVDGCKGSNYGGSSVSFGLPVGLLRRDHGSVGPQHIQRTHDRWFPKTTAC